MRAATKAETIVSRITRLKLTKAEIPKLRSSCLRSECDDDANGSTARQHAGLLFVLRMLTSFDPLMPSLLPRSELKKENIGSTLRFLKVSGFFSSS
jgi:hypothetical protein